MGRTQYATQGYLGEAPRAFMMQRKGVGLGAGMWIVILMGRNGKGRVGDLRIGYGASEGVFPWSSHSL